MQANTRTAEFGEYIKVFRFKKGLEYTFCLFLKENDVFFIFGRKVRISKNGLTRISNVSFEKPFKKLQKYFHSLLHLFRIVIRVIEEEN